jgi:hypothetical protein
MKHSLAITNATGCSPCCCCCVVLYSACVCNPGKEVSVTVLGGSISTGAVASRKQAKENPNDVWSLVRIYLQKNVNGDLVFSNNAR